jgi:hypothetical protein
VALIGINRALIEPKSRHDNGPMNPPKKYAGEIEKFLILNTRGLLRYASHNVFWGPAGWFGIISGPNQK